MGIYSTTTAVRKMFWVWVFPDQPSSLTNDSSTEEMFLWTISVLIIISRLAGWIESHQHSVVFVHMSMSLEKYKTFKCNLAVFSIYSRVPESSSGSPCLKT